MIWMRKEIRLGWTLGNGDGGNIMGIGNLCRKEADKSGEADPKTSVHCQAIESKQKGTSHLETLVE